MPKTILVLAAHPDDEVLGCGGAMARHAAAGDEVISVILAEGITSRDDQRDRDRRTDELSALGVAARQANNILGVKETILHDFPDNRMDSLPRLDVVKVVEALIDKYSPEVIYSHHRGDVNVDHRRIHDAVVTACRPMPGKHRVETVLFFEVASSTEWQPPGSAVPFTPDWFVDVSEHLSAKLDALRAYQSEMRPWPHARSIEAVEHLARWRGANIGVPAAEAFKLGRQLIR
jgi:LmbE family N-acetylglucosaminyl deacetylase